MGNHITIITWPTNEHDAALVREFLNIRQRLGIAVDFYQERPNRINCSYVNGQVSGGFQNLYRNHNALSQLWLSECRKYVLNNSKYGINPIQVEAEQIFLPM